MALRGASGGSSARARGEERRALDEFEELAGLRGPGAGGERGAYVLEHLATFTVTRETGIVFPADGMRRLLQLEKTNGIWSQKMQLCLDGQWVLIMDYETGSIMERFPAAWVHSPTAFTSPEPTELYNNVLAFVVGSPGGAGGASPEPGAPGGPRRELHIFQCHDVGAQTLVEELNALKGVNSGGSDAGGRDFAIERERERERERDTDLDRPRRQQMSAQLGRERSSVGERDDASSTGSERLYEQDIAILNRCFDDIEKFIARLQHAAAASRELERRRRSRGGKRPAAGEGMLALRTRPPPERDFVDVLQKFKLSFNLLARLRAHIHDPNAPELVHFLFTPLALIVDAAQDAADGRLPTRVVQPLLTRDALNLLANCVTSKETELWHSLGDAWLIPREQWKTTIPPYQPVFMDGWSPDYQVDDQPLRRASPRGEAGRGAPAREVREVREVREAREAREARESRGAPERAAPPPAVFAYDRDEPDLYAEQYSPNTRVLAREDSGSAASSPDREPPYRDDDALGEAWARGVAARGGRVVRVTYPRTANNDKELTVVRGEFLEVLDDSRKWWKARNRRGVTAHVPHTIVAPAFSPPASPDAPRSAIYPNPIYTHSHYQDGGGRGSGGSSPDGAADKAEPTPLPPPLPPPPPPAPSSAPVKTDTMKSTKSTVSTGSSLQDELRVVLPQIQQRRNKLIDIKKTPDIFIHQKSNPDEVVEWLEAKGFSSNAQRALRVPGHALFALTRAQLEAALGADEGKRLYSQVLVQRNVSGYKTTSASELQNILRKVREKVEVS
ncbi:epidermal growth factor receptor kinase substrate 8-like protein 1 isoform X2 [Hyposmocoma kahamanoa]|uniref:epidermal growth factor receptor kinase substrate 8-like protein 1 isoform X2 n=1 Tax=Hyposmocoma kahamanoa TaxID=1477025 RepID=UPI000E6D83F1|nr:epidermal growth factor receptor kinase substrate 8-like protein 1 isoform X2 [Hyposmocoma kahamanoa]